MRNNFLKKVKNDSSGEIMLESTIIVTMVLIMLIVIIAMGFVIYQQVAIYSITTETATAVARNYKYSSEEILNSDYATTTIDKQDYISTQRYRNSFNRNRIVQLNKKYAKQYVEKRLPLTSLSMDNDADVDVQIQSNIYGRTFVTVTVSMKPSLLFSGALLYEGYETGTLSATSTAECLDVAGYVSSVMFSSYLNNKANDTTLGKIFEDSSSTVKKIEDIIGIFNNKE